MQRGLVEHARWQVARRLGGRAGQQHHRQARALRLHQPQADVLARAKGTSVSGLTDAGVVESGKGELRLLK